MKRTATTLVLLAGLGGGGCVSPTTQAPKAGGFGTATQGKEISGVQGPMGEPVMARGTAPSVRQAGGSNTLLGNGSVRSANVGPNDGVSGVSVPGVGGNMIRQANFNGAPGYGASGPYGPQMGGQGILPVPTMGPPGAVAAVGALARAA